MRKRGLILAWSQESLEEDRNRWDTEVAPEGVGFRASRVGVDPPCRRWCFQFKVAGI